MLIGNTPPQTFQGPVYAVISIVTAIIVFYLAGRRKNSMSPHLWDILLLVMDTLGLGIFTVVGISTAHQAVPESGQFLLIFVGVITGVGGGVVRDMMAGNMPYIFVKHIYACASLAGAVCMCLWLGIYRNEECHDNRYDYCSSDSFPGGILQMESAKGFYRRIRE